MPPFAALPVLAAAVVVSFLAWRAFGRADVTGAALGGVAASALLAFGVLGLAQPVLRSLKLSPRLAEVARGVGCADLPVGTVGYREPSLVFLLGTDLKMLDNGREAAAFSAQGGCRLTFVDSRHEALYRATLAELGVTPELKARVAGFNINGGRVVEIGAYVVRPSPP